MGNQINGRCNCVFLWLILLIAFNLIFAQVEPVWIRRFTGPGAQTDEPADIIVHDGYVYVTGTSHAENGYRDIVTLKYSQNGDLVWSQRYNGSYNHEDQAWDMAIDKDDNIVVLGTTTIVIASVPYTLLLLLKYQSDGTWLWEKSYAGDELAADIPGAVQCDTSGYIYVACSFDGYYSVMKCNPNGYVIWYYKHESSGWGGRATDLALDSVSNVHVTGYYTYEPSYTRYLTYKYTQHGTYLWHQTYGGGEMKAMAVVVDSQSNAYVTGYTGGDYSDFCTIKYNSNGGMLWVNNYNNGLWDAAHLLEIDTDENIIVSGTSQMAETDFDWATIKYSKNGDTLWCRTYNGPWSGNDGPNDITTDKFNNIYVTGGCDATPRQDCVTIKYSPIGEQLWLVMYDAADELDIGRCIDVDDSGYVYVGAESMIPVTGIDYATIKYWQETGISEFHDRLASEIMCQINPNPFERQALIKYNLPLENFVHIVIYNILGEEVMTLVEGKQSKGTHKIFWNCLDNNNNIVPSGIYFLRFQANDFTSTEKLILMR